MKTFKILFALAFVALFASCSNDDDNNNDNDIILSETEIPTQIMSYISEHFPDNAIVQAVQDNDDNTVTYEVLLEGNFELDFNSDFEIIDIDGISALPDSVIPQAILDYVSENYPDNYITDWKLELTHQQIELNNGLELEFEMDGTFIRIDND